MKLTTRFEQLIKSAADQDASNLFLIPGEPLTLRIKGQIQRIDENIFSAREIEEIAQQLVNPEALASIGTQIGEIVRSYYLPGIANTRIGIARASGEITISVGIVPDYILSAERIKVPKAILDAALSRHGILLFSGPIGSGKSTTLYGVTDYINENRACHIGTVEQPILMRFTPKKAIIQQREVGVDVPNMVSGIQACDSQEIDVLLIPEITNLDVLQACLSAAERGYLVLTLVHCSTPQDAIQRVIDVFPEDSQPFFRKVLAEQLVGVCSQRLLPKAGVKGVVPVYGVLIPDDEMRIAIESGSSVMDRKKPFPVGCQTLSEHLGELIKEGLVTTDQLP